MIQHERTPTGRRRTLLSPGVLKFGDLCRTRPPLVCHACKFAACYATDKTTAQDIADIARLPAVFRPDISSGAERSSRSTLLIGDGFPRRIGRSPCDLRRELKEFERNTYIRLVASKKLEILVFRGGRHFLG